MIEQHVKSCDNQVAYHIMIAKHYIFYYDSISLTIFHVQTPINLQKKTFLLTEFCYCLWKVRHERENIKVFPSTVFI